MKHKSKVDRPCYDLAKVAAIGNEALTGLQTYYRETNALGRRSDLYKPGLVIQEAGFIDVTSTTAGPAAYTRYHLLTNQTSSIVPSFLMYDAFRLPRGCYFKVLDVLATNMGNLVTLLHIDSSQVEYFATHTHPGEEALAIASREQFLAAVHLPPSESMADDYWLKRTTFPLGIDDNGAYFFNYDYSQYPHLSPFYRPKSLLHKVFAICRRHRNKLAS